jgi:hypothetical protein
MAKREINELMPVTSGGATARSTGGIGNTAHLE